VGAKPISTRCKLKMFNYEFSAIWAPSCAIVDKLFIPQQNFKKYLDLVLSGEQNFGQEDHFH
jgi:hypothetical protein